MRLGFGLPVAGDWATPDALGRIARRAEERGYATLWTYQRLLGLDEPGQRSVLDPVVALAYVAGHTDRIRLGTATICAPFTAPALLAKSLASLDVVSGGRLTAGLGLGWRREEYTAAGVPFERRGARMDAYFESLKQLWVEEQPRPVQRPHPPLLLGGTAAPALRRAATLANGWIASSKHDLHAIEASIATVRGIAHHAQIVVRRTDARDLDALAQLGVDEVILDLNFAEPTIEHALGVLDEHAPA